MRYLLDTNTVIALLKERPTAVARMKGHRKTDLAIPAIVMHELFFGAYKSVHVERNLAVFLVLQQDFAVLDYHIEDAREAAAIRADLARIGKPIGPYDVLIAGQAKARDLCIVTNNTREFSRVAGLRVEDWTL